MRSDPEYDPMAERRMMKLTTAKANAVIMRNTTQDTWYVLINSDITIRPTTTCAILIQPSGVFR